MKREREIRKFHVAVMQRRLKSVMYMQSCPFATINLWIFCLSRCRRRRCCQLDSVGGKQTTWHKVRQLFNQGKPYGLR